MILLSDRGVVLKVSVDTISSEKWDDFVAKCDYFGHIQSWGYGTFKEYLGWKVFRVVVFDDDGPVAVAQMFIKEFPVGLGSVAHVPRGPVVDRANTAALDLLYQKLQEIAQEHKAVFLKVEPPYIDSPENRRVMIERGFQESVHPIQPEATVFLDLTPPLDEVFKGFSRSTRNKINASGRKGLSVRRGGVEDIPTFYQLMFETFQRTGMTVRAQERFEAEFSTFASYDRALLVIAEYDGKPVAAHIGYRFGRWAGYFHGGSSADRANLNPNALLIWEQVKWAKEHGCTMFDLWGIPGEVRQMKAEGAEIPEERTDGQWGVFKFKRGFSKDVVAFVGSFDQVFAPRRYALISRFFEGDSALEKVSSWIEARRASARTTS